MIPLAIIENLDPEKPSFIPLKWPRQLKLLKIVNCQNCQKTVLSQLKKVGGHRYPPGSTVPLNAKSSGTKDTENSFSILAKEVEEGEPVPSKEVQEGEKGDQNSEDKGNQPTEEEGAQNKQAEARKQYKAVTEVQVQNKTIADPEGIKQAAYEAFEMLYTEPKGTEMDQQRYPLNVIPKLINEDTNSKLTREVMQQEIKEALDQMNPDKSLGPDRFTARFHQQCWNIIKKDLTKMIQKS